jgi:hypothetical protein
MRKRGIYFSWDECGSRARFMLYGDECIGEKKANIGEYIKLPRAGCIAALLALDSMLEKLNGW